MTSSATFLHVTDTHLAADGTVFEQDDHKIDIPGIGKDTREAVLDLLFQRLAERLGREGRRLDGVLFSGDAQHRGRPGGHRLLLDLLLKHFGALGVTAGNIVASPGNHDVPRDSPPGSAVRYAEFNGVWRAAGCVVPWLDGIDPNPAKGVDSAHRLLDADRRWVVYPVNTSNWCHAAATLPDPLGAEWEGIPALLAAGDADKEETLRRQLDSLARYDMARVSGAQLEALRTIVEATPSPISGSQIRIAMMHHHLRAPSLREELKPFPDV